MGGILKMVNECNRLVTTINARRKATRNIAPPVVNFRPGDDVRGFDTPDGLDGAVCGVM